MTTSDESEMRTRANRAIRVGDLLWTKFEMSVVVGTPYEDYEYEDLDGGEPLVFVGSVWVLDFLQRLEVKVCSRHGLCWACAYHLSLDRNGKRNLDSSALLRDSTVIIEYDARGR